MKKIIAFFMTLTMLMLCAVNATAATANLGLGQTWKVTGQWEFTINEVKEHNLCNNVWNESEGLANEQVVIIDYSYKNIGYEGTYLDLYIDGSYFSVYDETGEAGVVYYGCGHTNYPKECVVGTKCSNTSVAFALKNYSKKITVKVEEWSSNDTGRHTAIYNIPVGENSTSQTQTKPAPQNTTQQDVKVTLDGQRINFDVQPTIINGRTMVPLRAIFESLDASVNWNGTTRMVTSTKGNTNISLTVDSSTMYVNGSAITLDCPARIINGRTLVPVRAISEAFNCLVDWNNNTRTVIIISDPDVIYNKFIDFVKEKGSYNQGKYGISTSIPKYTSDEGTVSWGSVSLLYDTSNNMLQLQILMDRDSVKSGESSYFLILDLKKNAEQYNWEYQRAYKKSGGFWAARGTLRANAKSYVTGDNIKLTKMIYGTEIMNNDMVIDVGLHMSLASAYMNNIFKDNGSSLTFGYFGIK